MISIIICDDEADSRQQVQAAVQKYASAYDCLHSLPTTDSIVALLDIYMPDMKGTELAQHIRAQCACAQIVFLTSSSECAVEAFALNAAHYLVKPFGQAEFEEAMNRALAPFATEAAHSISTGWHVLAAFSVLMFLGMSVLVLIVFPLSAVRGSARRIHETGAALSDLTQQLDNSISNIGAQLDQFKV